MTHNLLYTIEQRCAECGGEIKARVETIAIFKRIWDGEQNVYCSPTCREANLSCRPRPEAVA